MHTCVCWCYCISEVSEYIYGVTPPSAEPINIAKTMRLNPVTTNPTIKLIKKQAMLMNISPKINNIIGKKLKNCFILFFILSS